MSLRLAHLYPKLMNLYGDRGNILSLAYRCQARGIEFSVDDLELGEILEPGYHDLIFMGGAQDKEQLLVSKDLLKVKGGPLREAVERDSVLLAVCGAYQLLGRYYRTLDGVELPGIGLFNAWTEHPGPTMLRFIGNIVVKWQSNTLVGFENHGGRTYLGEGASPFAQIIKGYGNNGSDGTEGAVYKRAFGTYLHGSLLPKNPRFADHLISLALQRRYGDVELISLEDSVEERAHAAAVRIAEGRGILK